MKISKYIFVFYCNIFFLIVVAIQKIISKRAVACYYYFIVPDFIFKHTKKALYPVNQVLLFYGLTIKSLENPPALHPASPMK